ncbi:MAG: 6-bladed beta-propeller [Candidatus Aminicenantes bacterium]|jgi:DNA-binding beta-propeller fold protein YncE|nr:6-bladed beta-propeller [Candidatus Aminicenantes bacterium]
MDLKRRLIISSFLFTFLTGIIISDGPVKTVWSISSFGEDDFFHQPSDIEVDPYRSRIYVADSGNHRVLVFDFQGKFLKIIGSKGQGPAEFSNPTGLYILEDGGLAVADVNNNRIQIFDKDGEFVKSINTKSVRVADMIFNDNRIYTISSFGSSRYRLDLRSEKDTQPLVKILDNQGNLIKTISVDDFPESHPFLRAIKHRVCLALSKDYRLYVPHFAMNVIHVFDFEGKKIDEFNRSLPFKPGALKIVRQLSKDGIIRMQATFDFITQDAKIGLEGNLYLLTFTESSMDRQRPRKDKGMALPPVHMRIDVIDTKTLELIRHIEIDGDTRAFSLMNKNHIVYVYVDSEGEVIFKCIQY